MSSEVEQPGTETPSAKVEAPASTSETPPSPPAAQPLEQQQEGANAVEKPATPSENPDPEGGVVEVQAHHDTDEVKARLFAKPDLGSVSKEVSSIWGWVSSKSADLATQAQEIAQQAAPLAEKLSENVKGVAEIAEAKRKELLEQVQQQAGGGEEGVLAWDEPASKQFADAIKERILELSQDDKTFLVPPPDAVGFEFDYENDKNAASAMAMMNADANLSEKRFKLVPKEIKEPDFWRNYFYRVSLIKEAYQVSHDNEDSGSAAQHKSDNKEGQSDRGGQGLARGSVDTAESDKIDDDMNGWEQNEDDDLDLDDDNDNFDMLDDEELLASAGLDNLDDVGDDDEDDEALEERIKAELNLI